MSTWMAWSQRTGTPRAASSWPTTGSARCVPALRTPSGWTRAAWRRPPSPGASGRLSAATRCTPRGCWTKCWSWRRRRAPGWPWTSQPLRWFAATGSRSSTSSKAEGSAFAFATRTKRASWTSALRRSAWRRSANTASTRWSPWVRRAASPSVKASRSCGSWPAPGSLSPTAPARVTSLTPASCTASSTGMTPGSARSLETSPAAQSSRPWARRCRPKGTAGCTRGCTASWPRRWCATPPPRCTRSCWAATR
mmetsp:Transcript_36859/g.93140  ORF Transcript_36859/g.93140 Transcript_36859/m.93140 type:complete len:252 (-) Transcript_36859:871-1626(-)